MARALGAASPSAGCSDRPFPVLTFQIRTKWIPMVNGGAEKGARYWVRSWVILEAAGPSLPSCPPGTARIKPAVQAVAKPLVAEEWGSFSPSKSS